MIGPKRSKTTEGFLLCKDVALARVGEMVYGANELRRADGSQMFEGDLAGRVAIERSADVVFAADTINSFVGKPITIKHPDKLIDPKTVREHSHGSILNARRGEGSRSDFLVGDILITSQDGIDAVEHLREVSCGYDAEYEKISPGRGRQVKIMGNHLALVERGRCGPNCYVGDQDMSVSEEPEVMTTKPVIPGLATIRRLLGAATDAEAQAIISEAEATERAATADAQLEALKVQMATMQATLDEMTKKPADDEDEDDKDDKDKGATKDAATFDAVSIQTKIASAAEILSPGFPVPTFDATTTQDQVCACQREALTKAYATDDGKKIIDAITGGGADLAAMTSDQISATFFGGAHMMGSTRNGALAALMSGAASVTPFHTAAERSAAADKASKEKWDERRKARENQR